MTIKQLEYIMKVAECGSISKAAKQLYLSQPSLTKAIISLESEYEFQIFLRTAKGIELTEKGREFVDASKNVLMSVDTLNKTFISDKKGKHVLSLASQQFDFVYDVLLKTYCQYEPQDIYINLSEMDRGSIINAVKESLANIGIVVITEMDSKEFQANIKSNGLEMHVLDSSGLYLSIGPKSPFYSKDSVPYDQTGEAPAILLDAEEPTRLRLSLGQEIYDSPMLQTFSCNSINCCRDFLENTNMHLCIPKWVIGMFKDTNIRSIPITDSKGYNYPINELVWIKRSYEPLNDIERKFISLLELRFNNL